MYQEDCFYGITDLMHFHVYASLLKDHILKEERVVIKVFRKEKEVVVIETYQFHDTILKDTRTDKNSDLMEFDLIFLKTLERYYSDYEIPGMVYEYMEGIGAWYRVKIDGFLPNEKCLKPFFLKKEVQKEDLSHYAKNEEELHRLERFFEITKGLVHFHKPKEVEELFLKIEE